MKNYLNKHFFLNADAPIWYKFIRLMGHYITLPIKFCLGLFCAIFAIRRTINPLAVRTIPAIDEIIKAEYNQNKIDSLLKKYVQAKYLCTDFKNGEFYSEDVDDKLFAFIINRMSATSDPDALDKYEFFMSEFIKNDFSLLQGTGSPQYPELYKEFLRDAQNRLELVRMKSENGRFHPSPFLNGDKALTALAAASVYARRIKTKEAKQVYRRLLWLYGYGLLAVFVCTEEKPTGVGLMSLLKLHENSKSSLGRLYWEIMIRVYERRTKWLG